MFDGATSRAKVSLGGAGRGRSRPGNESRDEFLKRQHKEREEREVKRLRERSATKIQCSIRGRKVRRQWGDANRALFDKRCSDLNKVEKLLPPEQRVVFVFRALLPMLRPLMFFYSTHEDDGRLAKVLDMVFYSAVQQAPNNFLSLALIVDEAQRRSFLVLAERLLRALLRTGQVRHVARLLHLLHGVLFGQSLSPGDEERRSRALAHLLSRTDALLALTREAMLLDSPEEGAFARDLAALCSIGVQSVPTPRRLELLMCLLSTPTLWEQLAREPSEGPPHRAVVGVVTALLSPPVADDAAALSTTLSEDVRGSSRWAWLLGNLGILIGRLVTTSDKAATLVEWTTWAIARTPSQFRGGLFATYLAQVYSATFARLLLHQVDAEDSRGLLMAVLDLYFPGARVASSASGAAGDRGASSDDSGEPPTEVLQVLAFATPLTERLFPALAKLARSSSIDEAFEQLGAASGACDTELAVKLRAFCTVYKVQLQPMYDAEFFGPANPLKPDEVALIAPFLNRLAYRLVTQFPDKSALPMGGESLRSSLSALVRALYARHLRRPILQDAPGAKWWLIPEAVQLLRGAPVVDLGTDDVPAAEAEEAADHMDVDEDEASAPPTARTPAMPSQPRRPPRLGGNSSAREVLEAILEEAPHVLPFEDRVALLHNVILADHANREDTRAPWARDALRTYQIRRNFLVEDGFAAFAGLEDEDGLRDVFKVEFIAPDGSPESGIDGGGLFKEFMIHICRTTFDPEFGLFAATDDNTLYPSPGAFRKHPSAGELFKFVGKVVGKAIYEMLLLEPQFCRVFLNRILGRTNEVDDVASLDKELHRGMLRLREHDKLEELGLTFSISASSIEDVDLIPNGRNITVTKENLTRYLHVVANFRTNLQIQRHTAAFVQGLQSVIPLSWLKMFDPYELNTLVSGSTMGFDVSDLRENTVYGGGYGDSSRVVQWLWQLLQSHLDVEDMGRFLMFTTSCSRPPLLGFKTLYPKFGIHRVPDATRLPTAATCANLLKLPDYPSFEVLKSKLTEAIRAECGFDLS